MSSTPEGEEAPASSVEGPSSPSVRNEFTVTADDGSKIVIRLNWFDRVMRCLLSKEEFEARLLEKREKALAKHRKSVQTQSPAR